TNRGIFHGSVNMASIWDLPVIYLCENNVYGMSTSIKEAFNISKISDRKYAYGIDGLTIDGNNVVEVYNVISHYRDICLNGKGPVLVEALTYRWRGHSKSDAQIYRTKKEVRSWMDRDPIVRYGKELIKHGVMTQKQIDELEREVMEEMKKASDFAQKSPFPDPATVEEDVYA
ncbi:MAG: pyruvate dehydrogenase (acetyl-transferring) E1 component subunit alpha, partial [Actinomycetota bacterium]